jgi:hypothetical protein
VGLYFSYFTVGLFAALFGGTIIGAAFHPENLTVGSVGDVVPWVVLMVVAVAQTWWMAKAGVYVEAAGIVIRNQGPWSVERIDWDRIEHFDLTPCRRRWRGICLRVNLIDGERRTVEWMNRKSPEVWLGTSPQGIADRLNRARPVPASQAEG